MIRSKAELDAAIKGGATGVLELDVREPIGIYDVKRPLKLVGSVAPATLTDYFTPVVQVGNCDQLEIALTVQGLPNGKGGFNGRGIVLRKCNETTIAGADVGELYQGILPIECDGMLIGQSDIHDIQVDGILFQQMRRLQLIENWFRRFFPSGTDHADCAQAGTNASATDDCDDVLIARNFLDLTPADKCQGIFLGDYRFTKHRNVRVQANLCGPGLFNMIYVRACTDAIVQDNRLMQLLGSPYEPRIDWTGVAATTLTGNEAPGYVPAQAGLPIPPGNVLANAVAQDAIDAARAAWLAQYRPAAAPAPSPVPAPVVTPPAPPPAPAPAPAPAPSPVDAGIAQAWSKAWTEQHAITLASRRAETALLGLADKLGVSKP